MTVGATELLSNADITSPSYSLLLSLSLQIYLFTVEFKYHLYNFILLVYLYFKWLHNISMS